MTEFVRRFLPVLADWVEPGFDEVAAVRRTAAAHAEAPADRAGRVRAEAVGRALDWAAGMTPVAPVTGAEAPPTRERAQAERLAGDGGPAADALAWLLGVSGVPPL